MIFSNALGTNHRNHCPLCLWSKHVDNKVGDRKSYCQSRMKPIGLVFKDARINPFTNRFSGELQVVHMCLGCKKISANRIAGDDNTFKLLELIDVNKDIRQYISHMGIKLLDKLDKENILITLFGYNYEKYTNTLTTKLG